MKVEKLTQDEIKDSKKALKKEMKEVDEKIETTQKKRTSLVKELQGVT